MQVKLISAIAGCVFGLTGLVSDAQAFEGNVAPYPAGAAGANIASMPPIPGLFVMEQFNYSFANGLYGNDAQKLPVPFHSSVFSATTRLLAAYPLTILGANIYSQLVIPVVSLHTNVYGNRSTQNGLSNITVSPIIFKWNLSRSLTVATGIDLALENGSYSPVKASVAVGYTSIQPVLSVRYNMPDSIDLGLSNRFLINQKNRETGYQSGTGYAGEFQAGWHFGSWEIGVVGAYINQFSNDRLNGVPVADGGNRMRSLAIGPSIVYDAGPFNINLNYQQGIYAANTARSNNVWLNLAIPLWVLGGR